MPLYAEDNLLHRFNFVPQFENNRPIVLSFFTDRSPDLAIEHCRSRMATRWRYDAIRSLNIAYEI